MSNYQAQQEQLTPSYSSEKKTMVRTSSHSFKPREQMTVKGVYEATTSKPSTQPSNAHGFNKPATALMNHASYKSASRLVDQKHNSLANLHDFKHDSGESSTHLQMRPPSQQITGSSGNIGQQSKISFKMHKSSSISN